MQLQEKTEGPVTILSILDRSFDAHAALAFRERVTALIESGQKQLVIDLSAVELLDSTGLGALVSVLKRLGSGGSVALCGAGGTVMSVFKLTRMDRVFRILPDQAAAVAVLSAHAVPMPARAGR